MKKLMIASLSVFVFSLSAFANTSMSNAIHKDKKAVEEQQEKVKKDEKRLEHDQKEEMKKADKLKKDEEKKM